MIEQQIAVLFVCTGNICRSPTAEGVFHQLVKERGLTAQITVDSAGTTTYHRGEAPDQRSQAAALKRGYDLSEQRSRPVSSNDCEMFDYIITMDEGHLHAMKRMCNTGTIITPLLSYAPELGLKDVPDPYYGISSYGVDDGFEHVLDLIERSCKNLLDTLIQKHFS